MTISENAIKKIREASDVFELVANLYQLLDKMVKNEVGFINTYIDEASSDEEGVLQNPNLETLNAFFEKVLREFEEFPYGKYQSCVDRVIGEMLQIPITEFGDKKLNEMSVVCFFLMAIDSAAQKWDRGYTRSVLGPLNNKQGDYLVYLRCGVAIHDNLIDKIGRKPRGTSGLADCLHNFIILKRTLLAKNAGVPCLKLLSSDREMNESKLRVAVIPGISGKHFTTPSVEGSRKVIQYIPDRQDEQADVLVGQIGRVIAQGAEFIILPEYSVSEHILHRISAALESWKVDDHYPESRLIAVFAGSTWTEDDNNVQVILDAWGHTLGKYYKYSPFTKRVDHKCKKGRATIYDISEGLQDPGKECTLIGVEKIGCFLPAICRDIIDDDYTANLIKIFHPAFVMVAAWSSSSNSFKDNFSNYAALYLTNSILCNACGALDSKAKWYAGVMMLGKRGTVPKGKFREAKRDKDACENCGKTCSYLFELDFATDKLYASDRVLITEVP